jgi:hypothetical protein
MDITGLGSVADLAKSVVERFFPPAMTEAEKTQAELGMQKMLQERETGLIETTKSVIVAEMQQGDNYTKRARPTIVYAGLVFIFLVHVVLPSIAFFKGTPVPKLILPQEFWWAWGGVCSVWIVGRSAERRGITGKLVGMITGRG